MTNLLADGRVPHTPLEHDQAARDRLYEEQDQRAREARFAEHDPVADEQYAWHLWASGKQLGWTVKIGVAIKQHGDWFGQRAAWNFFWQSLTERKWIFWLGKSGEPTIMDVPDPACITCYVTEMMQPIEFRTEGTDPDAVGQAALDFIGQIKLPVQNVPMPMEREEIEGKSGLKYLRCLCKLPYGTAYREFVKFSPTGPWVPRRRDAQLLGHPMQQLHGTT